MTDPAEQEAHKRQTLTWPQAVFALALAGITFVIPDPWVLGFVVALLGLALCASFAGGSPPPRWRDAFGVLLAGLCVLAVVRRFVPAGVWLSWRSLRAADLHGFVLDGFVMGGACVAGGIMLLVWMAAKYLRERLAGRRRP
jgi:hypothetical protein